jgi:hypothetical protein
MGLMIQGAERNLTVFGWLYNDPRLHQRRPDTGHAAQNCPAAECRLELSRGIHAILQCQNDRMGGYNGLQQVNGWPDTIGFDAE